MVAPRYLLRSLAAAGGRVQAALSSLACARSQNVYFQKLSGRRLAALETPCASACPTARRSGGPVSLLKACTRLLHRQRLRYAWAAYIPNVLPIAEPGMRTAPRALPAPRRSTMGLAAANT